jgi:hypothetical protein
MQTKEKENIMINARVVFTDSGTGESGTFDFEAPEITRDSVALEFERWMASTAGEDPNLIEKSTYEVQAWVPSPDDRSFAFIISYFDSYFGHVLVSGLVYI